MEFTIGKQNGNPGTCNRGFETSKVDSTKDEMDFNAVGKVELVIPEFVEVVPCEGLRPDFIFRDWL